MKELTIIGIATTTDGIENLVQQGREWIDLEQQRRHPRLDLFGEKPKSGESCKK